MTTDPATPPDWVAPSVWSALLHHRAELAAAYDRPMKSITYTMTLAGMKAHQYVEHGSAYLDLQPGNGTAYGMCLIDLVDQQAQAGVAQSRFIAATTRRVDGRTDLKPGEPPHYFNLADEPAIQAAARRRADTMTGGPAGRWGGELLVALPDLGRCRAYGMVDYWTPQYVGENLGFGSPADYVPLAEFLTLFGSTVLGIRDGSIAHANRWDVQQP